MGVIPDVKLRSVLDNAEYGESALKYPLGYDHIEPVPIEFAGNRKELFNGELCERFAARLRHDPQFQDIAKDVRQLNERLKSNRLSLNEATRRTKMAKDTKQRENEEAERRNAERTDQSLHFDFACIEGSNKYFRIASTSAGERSRRWPAHMFVSPTCRTSSRNSSPSILDTTESKLGPDIIVQRPLVPSALAHGGRRDFADPGDFQGLSQFSNRISSRWSISFLMSLMSVNWAQRVRSQLLGGPSISTINSSTNPSLSGYFSRRCCLQMSAVCLCRCLVPRPI